MICFPLKTCLPGAVMAGLLLSGAGAATAQAPRRAPASPARTAHSAIEQKLTNIIIPNIEFRATTLRDAIEYLRQESQRLDVQEPNPDARGVNIILQVPAVPAVPAAPAISAAPAEGQAFPPLSDAGSAPALPARSIADTRITLKLSRIPLMEALRYVGNQAGLKIRVEPYAVTFVPLSEDTGVLKTATFRVPPSFLGSKSADSGAGAGPTN